MSETGAEYGRLQSVCHNAVGLCVSLWGCPLPHRHWRHRRLSSHTGGFPHLGGAAGSDVEEYDDAEDPGYVREDVRGQDAFMARELDLSDDDASGRGADVYHRALLMRASPEARLGMRCWK